MDWPEMLVGGSQGLYLIEKDKSIKPIKKQIPIYGISWAEETVYLYPSSGKEMVYQISKGRETRLDLPRGATHQCLFHKGLLYLMHAPSDSISVVDLETKKIFKWNYTGKHGDGTHLNSIWIDQEESLINICEYKTSTIRRFCLDSLKEFDAHQIGFHPHCSYREGEWLYVSSSGNGEFVRKNLATEKIEVCLDVKIHTSEEKMSWLRGIAQTEDYWILGVGMALTRRADRATGAGNVVLLDRKDFSFVDRIVIPDSGNIFEVRTLAADRCHNNLPCPTSF